MTPIRQPTSAYPQGTNFVAPAPPASFQASASAAPGPPTLAGGMPVPPASDQPVASASAPDPPTLAGGVPVPLASASAAAAAV